MAINTAGPMIFAAACFYMAGGHYAEFKVEQNALKEEVMEKTQSINLNLRSISVASLNSYETST